MPRPLTSQFISEVMDGRDLSVGKHWGIISCNLHVISDVSFLNCGVLMTSF